VSRPTVAAYERGDKTLGAETNIEWCHHTKSTVWGCKEISPACAHCYAKTHAHRYGWDVWGDRRDDGTLVERRTFGEKYWNDLMKWDRNAAAALERRRVFCGSMCDVFEDHPTTIAELRKLWPRIRATPNLDWLLLTKRPERVAQSLPADWGSGYHNVWLMTTIENNAFAWRADELRKLRCCVRGLSCEPLLGRLDEIDLTGIDWIIGGGESGNFARPMREEWIQHLRDRCISAGVAFFFKKWGGNRDKRGHDKAILDGRRWTEIPIPGRVRPALTALSDGTQRIIGSELLSAR
jgi:protein gp37